VSGPDRPRLILADDSGIILDALDRLLRGDYDVVAAVRDGEQLIEAALRLRPDVIVTDMNMPKLSGLEALRRVKASGLDVKFVLLTVHGDPAVAGEAFRAGGSGYLLKHSATEELPLAIAEVLLGRTYLTPQIALDEAARLTPPDTP
jgi:DNA-binding NarL/FixJ family response regulator